MDMEKKKFHHVPKFFKVLGFTQHFLYILTKKFGPNIDKWSDGWKVFSVFFQTTWIS